MTNKRNRWRVRPIRNMWGQVQRYVVEFRTRYDTWREWSAHRSHKEAMGKADRLARNTDMES